MKYVLLVNDSYINSFESYTKAIDERDNFLRRFPNIKVEIQTYEED